MSADGPSPPRLTERILGWCLPRGTVGNSILGDLREEWAEDLRTKPAISAHLRYLRNAASVTLRY
ncbi:hypothetical protein ACFL3S_03195, partial [Gemmatimonadota bacterium]